ncbi:hypothetical protein CBR_g39999 [Chara braunii]|uniref:Uncharacterized protein n=1 Tax=Chara braunii TaxID=69332 RepID=A0A388LSQ1_CHABU|nr:hypothetical protein CBR_g39999 [Chara braunii]|eukprot:GBG85356.1 hypothetical protein CBR_g39999 [Chara braunii]
MFGRRRPSQCIFEVKRLMGRSFLDPKVSQLKYMWPFELVAAPSGGVLIRVPGAPDKELFEPEEISAQLLKEMKRIAENFLGGVTIKHAVITVPAYFNDSQREATKKAGTLAGLEVLRLMNEPTAAAVAYGHQRLIGGACAGKKIMVFDLGGGTFDVSIIAVKEGTKADCDFEVRAVEGESHLGGADFDNALINLVEAEYERQTKQIILQDLQAREMLREAVIAAKHSLSFEDDADIELKIRGVEFSMSIERAKFESLNEERFQKCIAVVEKALRGAGMRSSDISEVILAGGSTRIPKLKELLTRFFDGRRPLQTVQPDEVVAYGAAVQAGLLAPGLRNDDRPAITVTEITSLSIGVNCSLDVMSVIIPKGSRVPANGSTSFFCGRDFQSSMLFKLYEGERALCRHNRYFGEFLQEGFIPSQANGKTVTKVELEVNCDGIVCATAEATANHVDVGSKVGFRGVLRKDGALAAAVPNEPQEDWEATDKALRAAYESRKDLKLLAWKIRENLFRKMSEAQKAKVNEVLKWLDSEDHLAAQSAYDAKLADLTRLKNEIRTPRWRGASKN